MHIAGVWNGEATTLDLMWESLPILTITGQHMSNRFGHAAAQTIGVTGGVVYSLKEYEDLAIELVKSD